MNCCYARYARFTAKICRPLYCSARSISSDMLLAVLRGKQGSWVPGRGPVSFFKVQPCKRIQTHRRPYCTSKPDADLCTCVCAWIYRWTKHLKIRTGSPGLRASGSPGRRRPRAAGFGPLGLQAAGPLDRRGPWAAEPLGRGPAFSKTPCKPARYYFALC